MNIGITGPISEVNFGDYGMLVNNVFDLGKEHEYTFFYYERDKVTEFDNIASEYFNDFKIKKIEVKFNKAEKQKQNKSFYDRILHKLTRKLIKRLSLMRIPKPGYHLIPLEILEKLNNYNEVKEYVESIDVLVVNGGGYFNSLWSTWHRKDDLYKIMTPIILASQLKKRIFFTGNSYGPYDESTEFYKAFFNSLDRVRFGVRDKLLSPSYLRELGILNEDIVEIPDDLLILNSKIKQKKDVFGLKKNSYVVIETYLSLDKLNKYENIISELLKILQTKYGQSVVFLPFQKESGGEIQGKYFKSLNKRNENFYLYDINSKGFPEIVDVYNLIKNASLVVGTRYHTLVIALGAQVPVLNIMKIVSGDHRYYYNKSLGVLNMVFENQIFSPKDFLFFSHKDAYIHVIENYFSIIEKQRKLFSVDYQNNMKNSSQTRIQYLKSILSHKVRKTDG